MSDAPPIPVEGAIDVHVHLLPERLTRAVRDALAGLLDRDLAPDTYHALFHGAAERFLGER